MPTRLRLYDLRNSDLPATLGLCQDNVPAIASYVNSAQRRLLFCKEVGDEGWNGSFAEILFYVNRDTPYITLPREVARLEVVNSCSYPSRVNNQFFEYLRFGNGRMPKCHTACSPELQVFSRNNAVTFIDLSTPPQLITVFMTEPADEGKRVLIQGLDQNNNPITSIDTFNRVDGIFITLVSPFATSPLSFNSITGIQKDTTIGQVKIYQTDPTTGEQVLLLTMQPSETTASYRRYMLYPLPTSCCPDATNTAQNIPVTAIAKLEMIPVRTDTDYTLLTCQEAIVEECISVRYSRMDTPAAKQLASYHHQQAIRMLIGELSHYQGKNNPAVNFSLFGSARLEHLNLSMR